MPSEQSYQASETPRAYYPEYREADAHSEAASVSQEPYRPQPLWQSAQKVLPGQSGKVSPTQRLIVAIISVMTLSLFSMIVLTSTQNTITGLIGVGIMCGAIFLINLVFNWGR